MKKSGLGRGLGALIQDVPPAAPEAPAPEAAAGHRSTTAPVESIRANRLQPRHNFDEAALAELTLSVREHGVLQPLLVRALPDGYELIAGERRLRAARAAGLTEVPVLVTDVTEPQMLEVALVENLQREDLNVIEEAEGYRTLAETFGLTQEQIAQRVGKARATVTNALRLLGLPEDVRQLVLTGELSAGHAKALAGLEIPEEQRYLAQLAIKEDLSVRSLEKRVEKARRAPRKPRVTRSDLPGEHLSSLSEKLHAFFGTSVRLTPSRTYANGKKAKGCIEVDFYSNDELDRILQILGIGGD